MTRRSRSILVLGIGNTLLTDEGAGIAALHYMQKNFPEQPHVHYLDGGTLSFTLATELQSPDALIVLDAAELQAKPGTVSCFENTKMDHFLGHAKRSAHEVGLLDLLDIARLTDNLPERRALVGIQHDCLDWGDEPTAAVSDAIPQAATTAKALIDKWSGCHV